MYMNFASSPSCESVVYINIFWCLEPVHQKIDLFIQNLLKKKFLTFQSVFDELEPEEMRRARTRSNPYETIRGVFFLNR